MLKFYDGTVFNANTHAIVNTVNCTGVMGAGIALEFKLRYPEMYQDYENKCKENFITTGSVDYFNNNDGQVIINFPTKWHFKYPSKMIWIEKGLQHFRDTYKEQGITSVAFPKLGTNKGGLNWEEVKTIMEKYLSNLDIDVYICLDKKKEAEGIEKKMLEKFNSTDITEIAKIVNLSAKQNESIQRKKPYSRFWLIKETESVGIKTYSALFEYFYDYAMNDKEQPSQISLFDE